MKRLIAGLIITALFPITTLAQKLTVVSATARKGHSGKMHAYWINYRITLEMPTDKIHLDSVYVGGRGYRLSAETNLLTDTGKHEIIITIEERHNGAHENRYRGPLRTFDGDALIVYTYKQEKRLFVVKELTNI